MRGFWPLTLAPPLIIAVRSAADLSHVFAGQLVGVTQVGEHVWPVTFVHCDVGYFDDETCRLEPIENPFGRKVLPMCRAPSVRIVVARLRS